MKAQRRHDLRENLLASEIGKVADFLKKNGSYLATGVLVVAVAVFAVVILRGRAEAKEAGVRLQWDRVQQAKYAPEFDRSQLVKELTDLTEQTTDKRLAALAAVELGDEFSRRILASNDVDRTELAKKAEYWYRWAISKFVEEDLAVGKAHLGLATLHETAGQFDQAATELQAVTKMTQLQGQPVMLLARIELQRLADLKQPVRMATTLPASQPAAGATTVPAPK
jgi:predicted negative regulator of RcsB-dependent stress response